MGEFYSHVLFPSRFFLDLEPTFLSQIIVHLHEEFSEPFGVVTLTKAVWEEKVSPYNQLATHSGAEGPPGWGIFRA